MLKGWSQFFVSKRKKEHFKKDINVIYQFVNRNQVEFEFEFSRIQ